MDNGQRTTDNGQSVVEGSVGISDGDFLTALQADSLIDDSKELIRILTSSIKTAKITVK